MPSADNGAAKAAKKASTGAGAAHAAVSAGKAAARATGLAGQAASRILPGAYFRDRAVLITGASSGIGRDSATTFARMGAHVAMIARRKSVLEDLAREIEAAGGTAIAIAADVIVALESPLLHCSHEEARGGSAVPSPARR